MYTTLPLAAYTGVGPLSRQPLRAGDTCKRRCLSLGGAQGVPRRVVLTGLSLSRTGECVYTCTWTLRMRRGKSTSTYVHALTLAALCCTVWPGLRPFTLSLSLSLGTGQQGAAE